MPMISAGNPIFRASLDLQCRLASLSWLRKCAAVQCFKARASSRSLPVRYIPKKSRQPESLQNSASKDPNFDTSKVLEATTRIIDGQEFDSKCDEAESKTSARTSSADARTDHVRSELCASLNLELKPELHAEVVDKVPRVPDVSGEHERYELPLSKRKKDAEKMAVALLAARFKNDAAAVSSKDGACSSPVLARYFPQKSQQVEPLKDSSPIAPSEDGMVTESDADFHQFNALSSTESTSGLKIFGWKTESANQISLRNVHVASNSESNEDIDYNVGMLELELMEDDGQDEEELESLNDASEGEEELESLNDASEGEEELESLNDASEGEQLKFHGSNHDAEKLAVELLAKRAFTAVELRKKLNGKGFPLSVVDRVVHNCLRRGLINDGLYAEMFSRSRWSSLSWGPKKIKQALARKGVNQADAEKGLELVFRDGVDDVQESKGRLPKSVMDQLYAQASKRWVHTRNLPSETRKTRIIRWLQYRGFDWGTVGLIVKRLESQHPA